MIPSPQKPVTVLYLGSLTHSDDTNFLDKTKSHEDQIDFQTAVRVALIRIPRPGKDIYSKHISITQTQTIKNFEIYYRNLQKTAGRYSLLVSNNELLVSQNDDILITPKQPIFTDLLLIKGNFTKITLCIYGNVLRDQHILSQRCPNFKNNAPIEPINQTLIQIKKDVFQSKREVVRQLELEIEGSNSVEEWHQVANDDGINEQQIKNICTLSKKLLTTYNNQRFSQENFVVQFRTGLQEISANLAKIFKNKHLGLYYPSFEDSNVSNDLCLSVTELALHALDLSLSEQVRGLDILRFMLQMDNHVNFFVENSGVQKLMKIFVDFFKINCVVLSTYKNLCLQVLISVSHWKKAASKMTERITDAYFHEIFEQKPINSQKPSQERERSRQKKTGKRSRSESESASSEEDNKKKKKDKQKKRNKSREKKKGKQSKSKQQLLKKPQEEKQQINRPLSLREEIPNISFYEILLFLLARQKSNKQLLLIKILLEQILQTMTKNKIASERVALTTSLLKDVKFVFNPAGEVLNTKSLKQFASTYQPFLNTIQSDGVDSEIIAQRQKLKNMKKYGIDPKVCRILNRISHELASSQSQQNDDQTRTPFDSSFIVMMSEIIRSRQPSVLYGLGRLLISFRTGSSHDIIHLKRIQAAMTMISEYIYKILVEDEGIFTVLNIDQIYSALINIANCLSKDPSAFTKQLKRKVRQLTNYAMAYDLFTSSEGNFKTISDYFLRLFKFQHYEINKINDYKKKQFDRTTDPLSIGNISQVLGLGNFHELFPQQPLLQIDVYLKIFNIVLQYNKNVWPLFYENKLVAGFSVLYVRLNHLLQFLLGSSVQRQCALRNIKKVSSTVENYLNVTLRLIKILAKKAEYESAFNDLLDEDNFQHVQIYQKSFHLYISLFNSINNPASLLSNQGKKLAEQILSKILQIFDKLLESYELTSHLSRQSKIKELWTMIYETHFIDLKSRAACLSLFTFFIESCENSALKLFNSFCLQESLKVDPNSQLKSKGYIPLNEKSIVQNLILANIYRSDSVLQNNLTLLIKNLIDKHSQKNPIMEKITPFLQNIFDAIDSKLKQNGNSFESSKDLIVLQKMVLLTNVLTKLNCVFVGKFQQKLIKHLKSIDLIRKDSINSQNKIQQKAYNLLLKVKTNIILFLKKSFVQKSEHSQILNFIQILGRTIDLSPKLTKAIEMKSIQSLSSTQLEAQNLHTSLINSSLEVICALSSNPFNQSMILYEVFLQRPYKPAPQISLINLFNKLSSSEFIQFLTLQEKSMILENERQVSAPSIVSNLRQNLKQISIRIVYFLCLLTTIQSRQFYSTQSRRNAIICILTEDKDFPFVKLEQLRSIVPYELIQNLKDYFAYPIVEKPLLIKAQEKKDSIKNKGYLFSKALFSIIMEGQPTAKSRYPFIGGPWKSGDLSTNFLYTPSRERNYSKNVERSTIVHRLNDFSFDVQSLIKIFASNEQKAEPQLIELSIKKRNKVVEKKQAVDTQIKILNIPLVLENQIIGMKVDHNSQIKRVSPSPSTKYANNAYGKGSSQQYDNRARVSPSPPSNKIPSQNIIGFNNLNQSASQYSSQNLPNTGYQPQMQTSGSAQLSNAPLQPLGQQMGMPVSNGPIGQQSTLKPLAEYNQQQQSMANQPGMQPPTYPNPYYSTNPNQQKSASMEPQVPMGGTLPYMQMQKANSQDSNGAQQMRSNSNSASRSNPPYGNGMGYQSQQQPYYGGNQAYMGQQGGQKMGGYDNRSHSPYQKSYSQNYGNQRNQYQQGGHYSQERGMGGGGYGGGNYGQPMMGNNPRHGGGYRSNQMGNRPPYNNPSNSQYPNNYDYQPQNPPTGQNFPPSTSYPPSNYGPNQEQERQFNEAILLVTELRGTLPDHLKNDKKNRLNVILHANMRVQNRVKEYINNLK